MREEFKSGRIIWSGREDGREEMLYVIGCRELGREMSIG